MKRNKKDISLEKKLEKTAEKILAILASEKRVKRKSGTADIFLLGDAEMKGLKKKFLPREKGPANVLSFSGPDNWPHPETSQKKLGEIYLNQELTNGDLKELTPLLIHGILHLLGYDHKKKSDRMKMEKLEERLKCEVLC